MNFPKMWQSYAKIIPNLRGVPLDGYIIFYQVTEVEIEIVRIVNGYLQ
nr:hypothetical protein [Okeania sp. SIO2F4]